MAISIDWGTKVITVPQADLTLISGTLYELDIDVFRLALKDLEDSEAGMPFLRTHNHNTEVTLSGVTYARIFEIINGYTVTFQDTGSPYTVRCVGANHNLADVTNYVSEVSLIIGNSAGLIVVTAGAGSSITSNVKQNQALANFGFLMTDSTNHAPATGLTLTVTRSIDGGAFAAGTLSGVAEIGDGMYKVDFAAADLNGKVVILKVTATGADTTFERIVTQP